jgi:hypothetical protein
MRYALLLLLLLSATVEAQTIFKCAGANGQTVYQQTPCANEAATIEQRTIRERTPTEETTSGPDARTSMARNVELSRLDTTLNRCLSAARARSYSGADARTAQLEAQKNQLLQDTRRANNNIAGASWEAGLRSQIAGIDSAIATERSAADALFNSERARCQDEARQSREDAERRFAEEDAERAEAAAQAAPAE